MLWKRKTWEGKSLPLPRTAGQEYLVPQRCTAFLVSRMILGREPASCLFCRDGLLFWVHWEQTTPFAAKEDLPFPPPRCCLRPQWVQITGETCSAPPPPSKTYTGELPGGLCPLIPSNTHTHNPYIEQYTVCTFMLLGGFCYQLTLIFNVSCTLYLLPVAIKRTFFIMGWVSEYFWVLSFHLS